ncbi:hypothetical protein [Caulobacter sp. NIBR1757]|uniref:hypothetical protein n=1 Tax=Caulobacter sp. NIBR1757 TaxID=3016000 RepID=UPI0022F12F7C|nr:hypothetical protein [Caulobacter sp. NIBR1757]WGM39896.1 hypothetical protein AMEJIAPC_02836 [Caulobacter sp. NIBR1757]
MEDLFRSYWWLLFPLGFFVVQAWDQWMRYLKHKNTLDLVKSYAEQGRDPPADLLAQVKADGAALDASIDDDDDDDRSRRRRYRSRYRRERGWYQVVLFGSLALGFGYAAMTDLLGIGEAAVIVAFVMGALCAASLVSTLMARRD